MSTTPTTDRAERLSAATRWRLDPAGSQAEFRVPHFWGLSTVKGHFDRLDGWLEVGHSGRRRIELTECNPEVRFHSTSCGSTRASSSTNASLA